MTIRKKSRVLAVATGGVCLAACAAIVGLALAKPKVSTALKEAKFNIEHNATDLDTGFQGFVDSEGWDRLEMTGPGGVFLSFESRGELGQLGLTELFFESVEPENADVPIEELLQDIPAGTYTYRAHGMEDGERTGEVTGTALLTHDIPAGSELMTPAANATVPVGEVEFRWGAVTRTIQGAPVNVIAYQLIVEKVGDPHPHMIGKWGLSMYLPSNVTSMRVPAEFFAPGTRYSWEVLAIEESGNQTLSSREFTTQ